MQKNMTQFKCAVNGKDLIFQCDVECTTIEAKEALFQFIKHVGKIEDANSQAQEKSEEKIESIEDQPAQEA